MKFYIIPQQDYIKTLPSIIIFSCFILTSCQVESTIGNSRPKEIRTLMVGGGSSHDFDRWYKQADAETLENDGLASVIYTENIDSLIHFLPNIDVLVLTNNQPISDPLTREAIFNFVASGKGLVLGHAALWYNWEDWPEYNNQLVSGGSRGHDPYGSFEVTVTNPDHPVTKDIPTNFALKDELYYFIPDSKGPGIEVLATASAEGSNKTFPSVFVVKHDQGRIVGLALGHDEESHNLDAYQDLLRNAVKWAANK